jgi:membrane protease YdiL (CAAX protease family)
MIDKNSLRFAYLFTVILSFVFAGISYFHIQYQTYLWEFLIDSKILLMALFLLVLKKRGLLQLPPLMLNVKKWNTGLNVTWFCFPFIISAFVILTGILSGEIKFDYVDNASTLILAVIVDVPAIFVFSATTILVEEIFFRGILINSVSEISSKFKTGIFLSFLFCLFRLSDTINSETTSVISVGYVLIYLFSIGIITTALVTKYHSVWYGYSFRIGLMTIMPVLLSSLHTDSDSFFKTKNYLFFSEGLVSSVFIAASGFFMLRKVLKLSTGGNEILVN